jgi:hypothetical protein
VQAFCASPLKKGRKIGDYLKWDCDEVAKEIAKLRSHQRRTIRSISANLGIPTSTIHYMYRNDRIIRHVTNAIKPSLTEANKLLRVFYAAD